MRQQQEFKTHKNECFFYFRYQMKLQFIPYIQEEIQYFIDMCEDQVHQPDAWERIMKVLNKRLADIDLFFNKNWNDYRAQQVLRSRKMLVEFIKKYSNQYNKPKKLESPNVKKSNVIGEKPLPQLQVQKNQTISQQRPKGLALQTSNKEKLLDKNKISWQKLPKNKIISSVLTPKNEKNREINSNSQRRSGVTEIRSTNKNINSRSRLSSSSSDNMKIKSISAAIMPKKETFTKKLTKQEYIAYLRSKNSQI